MVNDRSMLSKMMFEDQQTLVVSLCVVLVSGFLLMVFGLLRRCKAEQGSAAVVGTMLNHIMNIKRLHDYHAEKAEKYKTFSVLYPTCSYVFTADPINVEHILKTNFANYVKGKEHHDKMQDFLGDGIFAVDGEKWKQQRKMASVEFSSKMLRDFSKVTFIDNAMKLAGILEESAMKNENIEMQDLFMRVSMDAICKVVFGEDMKSLCPTRTASHSSELAFVMAFEEANDMMFQRYTNSLWKVKRFFRIGTEAIFKRHLHTIDEFLYNIIQSRRREANSIDKENVKPDILSRYISMIGSDSESFPDRYFRDMILNFMVGSRDTVAITLSWFLYMICKHQDIQQKIFRETCEVVEDSEGIDQDYESFANSLTDECLEKMHYLQATLSETLRLYPAIPVDGRYVSQDDVLPDGCKLKGGDFVNYLPYAMGRMTYIWGNDANQFKPERWLNENGVFQPQSPFKLTAFQGGPRICIGKDFAYTEMKIIAALLIHFFSFEAKNNGEITYKTMLTLHMSSEGLNVRVSLR